MIKEAKTMDHKTVKIRSIATTTLAAILVVANTQTVTAGEYDVFEYASNSASVSVLSDASDDNTDIFEALGSGNGTVAFAAGGYVISEGASGIGVSRDEATGVCTVTISGSGSYTLTGNTSNTVISIKKEITDGVSLTLTGLNIDNSNLYEAAGEDLSTIECGKSTPLNIIIEGNDLITAPSGGNDPEAVISQKKGASLVFSGTGSLEIAGSRDDSIKSKGDIKIESGQIVISDCHGDGIQGEYVEISGGELDITTVYENAATGFYTTGSSSDTLNTISENGNTKTEHVVVDTGSHKGIKAGTKAKTEVFTDTTIETEASGGLVITGGSITIDTTGSGLKANGLKDSGYTRTSTGVYIIGSPDDAIQSNNTLTISGGRITLRSSDDGISAAGTLTINGDAVIDIETAYEGIEGADITIGTKDDTSGPAITINSNDDGINTSGKTLTYTYSCTSDEDADDYNTDCNYTKTSVSSTSGNDCVIYSGTVTIYIDSNDTDNDNTVTLMNGDTARTISYTSSGDGIDCNGALDIEGGTVTVFGQSAGDNSPIDTNDGFTLGNAATVLAVGSDGMGESTPQKGDGAYIVYGQSGGMGQMMAPGMSGNQDGQQMAPQDMSGNRNGQQMAPGMNGGQQNGQQMTPPEMNGGQGMGSAQISAGSAFRVSLGDNTLVDTVLPYAASFILYASPSLTVGTEYTAAINDTTSTLTALAPGASSTNGGTNGITPPGMNGSQGGMTPPDMNGGPNEQMLPPGMGGDQNGQMLPPDMNGDQSGQMLTPGMNGDPNGQTPPPQDQPFPAPAEETQVPVTTAATSTETPVSVTIDGQEKAVSASVTYEKSITYTGKKITADMLGAAPDISSLTGAVKIRNEGYTADDLFTVKYIAKNNKNAGSDPYFYAKIVFSDKKAKKAGLTAAERKSVKAAVKALNSELKEKKCSFTIEPVDITSGTAAVKVKKLNSDGTLKTKSDGTLSSIKSVIYTGADGRVFKLGSKRCTVNVVNAETGEVQINGIGNFTGTLTAYASK